MLSSPANAVLASGNVVLWFARPEETGALTERYEALLSKDELERYQEINLPDFRQAYLVSRVLLRCALSHYFSGKPEDWRFARNQYGKPVLSEKHGLTVRFNTAHTEGLSVCAISLDTDLGVDIECYTGSTGFMELAEQHFSDMELADLASRPADDQSELFFKYWTLKESYIKAKGQGVSAVPLDSFSFRFVGATGVHFIPPPAHFEDREWSFRLMTGSERYMLALASNAKIEKVQYIHCIPEAQALEIPSFEALFDEPIINTYVGRI